MLTGQKAFFGYWLRFAFSWHLLFLLFFLAQQKSLSQPPQKKKTNWCLISFNALVSPAFYLTTTCYNISLLLSNSTFSCPMVFLEKKNTINTFYQLNINIVINKIGNRHTTLSTKEWKTCILFKKIVL